MKDVCPYCEDKREIQIVSKSEIYKIKGKNINVEIQYSLCSHCGNEFSTEAQMSRALEKANNSYREQEGIITPQKIIEIREKYGASQKAFSKILDLGELTINSLEQGSLASKSISNLISLVDYPESFTELFEKNKSKLSPFQVRKIESKLAASFVSSPVPYDLDRMITVQEKYTGFKRPDWELFFAMLQLILYYSCKDIYKMALIKIAFYCDFAAYKNYDRSLTGWPYAAINFGPVPEEYKSILNISEEMGYIISHPDDNEMGDLYALLPDFEPDLAESKFTDLERQVIFKVTDSLKNKTATDLKNLTHEEDAWKNTDHSRKIEYQYAKTLKMF